MKDEEMAKRFADKYTHYEVGKREDGTEYAKKVIDITIQQAFLAGLKAGRPQWHDLKKDPNDLPRDNNEVLVYMWDSYYIGYFNLDSWHFENFSEGKEQADAWCEIPTFNKE